MSDIQAVRTAIDGTVAAGAVTSPLWLQAVQTYTGLFMLLGGAALLILRLLITWREWQRPRRR